MEFTEFFIQSKTPITVLHVISVVFGMGAALMSDVLFTFYSKDKQLSDGEVGTLRILSRLVWWSLIAIFLSGLGLFLSDIPKYLASTKFLAKMSILVVLLVNGFILHKFIWKHVISRNFLIDEKEGLMRKIAFACGSVSVLSWIILCTLGVLDSIALSYITLMALYVFIIGFGILSALAIENKEFEEK